MVVVVVCVRVCVCMCVCACVCSQPLADKGFSFTTLLKCSGALELYSLLLRCDSKASDATKGNHSTHFVEILMDFHVLAHAVHSDVGLCLCRGGSSLVERAGQTKGRMAGMPKVSISPDFKRPPFNPTLYASPSSNSRGEANPRQTPVRRSRKSLREIKPHLEESARHSKASDVRGVGWKLCIWVYLMCPEGVDERIINVQCFTIVVILSTLLLLSQQHYCPVL